MFSHVEALQTHPAEERAPAHDAYLRLLKRLPPDSKMLWQEVKSMVENKVGNLVIDDRHHIRQTVCFENCVGDTTQVGQACSGCERNQFDFFGVAQQRLSGAL